jgi:thiol-disulfide isomerase/thioredoxin
MDGIRQWLGLWLAAMLLTAGSMTALPVLAEQTKAIDFQFTDLDGSSIRLSDYRGKWVLVNFWAPWCPLCWPEVPTLNTLNGRQDFVVIGVSMDYGPDLESVPAAAARHGMRFEAQVLGGGRRDANAAFRQVGPVDFYPTSYLYDPSGEVVMFIPGQLRKEGVLSFMKTHKTRAYADSHGQDKAQLVSAP